MKESIAISKMVILKFVTSSDEILKKTGLKSGSGMSDVTRAV